MPIAISLPGSKSITNRVLILAALTKKKVKIQNTAICDDSEYLQKALKKLEQKNSTRSINLYTSNAGTATRFLTAYCANLNLESHSPIILDGNKRMRERPIQTLVEALNKLGA